MNATVYFTANYDHNTAARVRQNKPNSNPIPQKPKMNANSSATKDYENPPLRAINPISNQQIGPPSFAPNPAKSSSQSSIIRRISTISGCCFPEILLTNALTLCRKKPKSIASSSVPLSQAPTPTVQACLLLCGKEVTTSSSSALAAQKWPRPAVDCLSILPATPQ